MDPIIDYATLTRAIIFSNIWALAALGLNMTYITTKIPSFAHGDLITIGAYVSYFTIVLLLGSGAGPGSVYSTFPLVAIITGVVAVLTYIGVFRPMIRRGASITSLMIASFGLHFVLFASVAVIVDYIQNTYHITALYVTLSRWEFIWPGLSSEVSTLINTTIVLIATTLLLYTLLYRTRYGVIMRASIDNIYLAKAVGINVERVFAIAWFLIGAVTGIAGVFMAMFYSMWPEFGWENLAFIFVAAVVGGLTNIYGAVLGGYVVGLGQTLVARLILDPLGLPTSFQSVVLFAMVIIILLTAPQGLVGIISDILSRRRIVVNKKTFRFRI